MNYKSCRIKLFAIITLTIILQPTLADILGPEHCPNGCLKCVGQLETQSYLKRCLRCDLGYYEYLGSCHNCPDKCTVCGSDRTCLRCNKFYTWEAEECVFSWLDLGVRVTEMLIVAAILYMCCYSFQKYRKQQEKYQVEKELKELRGKKRRRAKGMKGKSKKGKKSSKKAKKNRKSQINILDDSVGAINMDKTVDQSGLLFLIDEEDE